MHLTGRLIELLYQQVFRENFRKDNDLLIGLIRRRQDYVEWHTRSFETPEPLSDDLVIIGEVGFHRSNIIFLEDLGDIFRIDHGIFVDLAGDTPVCGEIDEYALSVFLKTFDRIGGEVDPRETSPDLPALCSLSLLDGLHF